MVSHHNQLFAPCVYSKINNNKIINIEIALDKYMSGQRASNLFLDPLGNHLLITLTPKSVGYTNEMLHLYRESNIPKKLDKFRDNDITAIAFNYGNTTKTTTGSILIGTSKGLIFETELSSDGDKRIQNNWKQVIKRINYNPILCT